MGIILTIIGIGITIFALMSIYFGNKKIEDRVKVMEEFETTLLEMKKNIEELDRRIQSNSVDKIKELEKVLKECDRRVIIFDNKLKEGHGLNAILERNFERISEVKLENKPRFHPVFEIEDEEFDEDDEDFEDETDEDESYDEYDENDEEFEDETFEIEDELTKEEILELYAKGKTLKEIAEIFGISLEEIGIIMEA